MGDDNSDDERGIRGFENSHFRHSKYYGRPRSSYIPDQGIVRYSGAMRHLIPVRKYVRNKEKIAVDEAGFFSYICFSWMSNYMYKAHRKGLVDTDIPQGSLLDSCEYNAQRLEYIWQQELVNHGRKEASFIRAIWQFSRTRILANMFVYIVSMIMGFLTPVLFMRRLLEYSEENDSDWTTGIIWACALTISEVLRTVFYSWSLALSYRTGIRLRSACLTLLYRKVIRTNSLPEKSLGAITNLFSNDSQRVFDVIVFGPMIVGGPFVMICGIVYTWWILDSWALIGIMVFVIYYPIQYIISRLCGTIREKTVKISDQRVSLIREILEYIKLIKMYGWENMFIKQLLGVRNEEHKKLRSMAYLNSLSISTAPTIPIISAVVTFLVYISTGHTLTAAQAFSTLTFLTKQMKSALTMIADCYMPIVEGNIIYGRLKAFPLLAFLRVFKSYIPNKRRNVLLICRHAIAAFKQVQAFPFVSIINNNIRNSLNVLRIGIENMVEASTSMKRLKRFLLLEEFNVHVVRPIDGTQSVCIGNGTFSVNGAAIQEKTPKNCDIRIQISKMQMEESEKEILNPSTTASKVDILSNINFSAGKGKLVGVCGPVASGKSSLLLAVMGQLKLISGQLARDGSFAYVSQESWILNCTLKENILFGEKFDAKKYYQAVYSCSLTEDIKILPGGDDTEIGERGVNLSGGQKQRVALARALYSNKDIYLLDDPLSAVDANVAAHIFKECVLTALKNKTVIFVSHQHQFLKQCSEIYMMKEGRIVENGTHDELMSKKSDYFVMVNATAKCSNRAEKKDNDEKSYSEPPSESVSAVPSKERIVDGAKGDNRVSSPDKQLEGSLNIDTYLSYVSAAGGYFVAFLVILAFFINVGSTAFSSWWLAVWIKAGSGNTAFRFGNETMQSQNLTDNPNFSTFQLVYALTIVLILVTSLLRGVIFTKATLNASRSLHNKLFHRMMHSNMGFFESNPIGRILNIFSKDIADVDSRLPNTLENMLQNIWIVAFAIFFICLVFPWFCLVVVVIAFAFFSISHIFRKAARDLKRIENATLAPVLSWVNASVHGLSTIHAFGKEADFISKFCTLYDANSTAMYMCVVAMRWLAVRIDSLAVITTAIISFMIVGLHGSVAPAMAGLALTYSAHISGVFQYTIRLLSETEMRFISVEQINRYCESMEPEETIESNQKPPSSWPNEGRIRFHNVCLRYRPNLPDVLRNINFSIMAGEKIGIVGRSGSGKSSLMSALFRLVELSSGYIKIDGIDIASVPLGTLRSKLTIIPQDPVLFSGAIRFNLDPKGDHTDEKIKAALVKTQLAERIAALPQGLNTEIAAGNNSMSVGERQLLCLTRALLRPTKILILDEATASVDRRTEAAVQNTIQREFSGCTVLTIAHRLNTVVNCDKVLVLGVGKVLEFESPNVLLANPSSEFSKLRACETDTTPANS